MTAGTAVAWLRKQIEGDRDAAVLAGGAAAEWCVRHGLCDEDCADPCQKAGQCHAELCWHAEVGGDNIHIYAEGGHDEYQAVHIALHDPQDVIADCEAKLDLLRMCEPLSEAQADRQSSEVNAEHEVWSGQILKRLASAYRHRDGYAGHWG